MIAFNKTENALFTTLNNADISVMLSIFLSILDKVAKEEKINAEYILATKQANNGTFIRIFVSVNNNVTELPENLYIHFVKAFDNSQILNN